MIVKSGELCDDDDVIIFNDVCFLDGICAGIVCACIDFGFCEEVEGYSCDIDGICIYVSKKEDDVCEDGNGCMYIDICAKDGGMGDLVCMGVIYSCSDLIVKDG